MNYRFLNSVVASFIAIVLVYYSVAWAVLRCFHDEDHTATETVGSVAGMHQRDFSPSPLNHPKAVIDCMGPSYHTETLAESSVPSQLTILTADITSCVNNVLTLHGIGVAAPMNLWLTALFDRGSTLPFQTDSPRYLSLSILRI